MPDLLPGPIGRRVLAALLAVGLSSVVVLLVATLVGVDVSRAAATRAERERLVDDVAAALVGSYGPDGGWSDGALDQLDARAERAGGHLIVVDASEDVIFGGPVGQGFRSRAMSAPILADGAEVGTAYIGFRDGADQVTSVSMTWLWVPALVAVAVAAGLALLLTRRLTDPLLELTEATRAFAGRDRAARARVTGPGEIGELARTFNAMADEVERTERARRHLSADIAHELRTPLAALQAGLEELRDGYLPADPATLSALHEEVVRLGRIVNDMSELAAAESPAVAPDLSPLDLSDLVSDTVVAWRARFADAGLELRPSVQMGVWVRGDEDRLHQVLVNLLSNAIRHGGSDGSDGWVEVVLRKDGPTASITVRDTGPGIPAEELPHVFERFYRGAGAGAGEAVGSTRVRGSGLGLAVVKALVSAHGGSVEVASQPGRGTAFTVGLPVIPPPGGPSERI